MDLVLSGNGPGELTGWIAPLARAAREGVSPSVRITLALTPSQFAGGRELDVVRGWGLFDRILGPGQCLRLALGLMRMDCPERGVLVHLGGDLWLSGRLASALRVPACALVETTLVARRHVAFARIFASSHSLAEALRARGVPQSKLLVSGDPRGDAFGEGAQPGRIRAAAAPSIAFLPGSRDRFFRILAPYFAAAGAALAEHTPGILVRIVASPFLSPSLVAAVQAEVARRWPRLHVEWLTGQAPRALAGSDLVVTIPGTNTMELTVIGTPFVVVLPLQWIDLIPLEGALEWMGRLPGLGHWMKHGLLSRYLARGGFLALPNLRGGRRVVPEWVGRWTPAELAMRIADYYADRAALDRVRTELAVLRPSAGAARLIVTQALALA